MTVGIDIRVLAGDLQNGIAQYLLNILPELIKLDPQIKFKLFFSSLKKCELDYEWLKEKNVELHRFKLSNHFLFASSRIFNRPYLDKMVGGADIFFSPHFFLAPLSGECKSAVVFHDLSFLRYPEFFSWRKNIWHRFEMNPKKQALAADKIIAVSRSTRNDLISFFGTNSNKIKVIYSGLSKSFLFKPSQEEMEKVKSKYQLPENFFLYLGKIEPRKNVSGIIRAFESFSDKSFHLVIAGELGWLCKDVLRAYNRSPYKRLIHLTGPVDEKDKLSVYQLSKTLIYSSFFEGFGFPPLEAMALGIPVITSRNSSMPEVVGDSALLVDPYDVGEISQAMESLIFNNFLRQNFVEKGIRRSKLFSWQKTAEETLIFLLS
ncbi:MAG: glycosyltransferase family 4 protein [Candidatus Yanofskybacteria bacterium]|nr:glycosyltransferase family 4 protein [Candidatus Yanofskybacteria bacterium]